MQRAHGQWCRACWMWSHCNQLWASHTHEMAYSTWPATGHDYTSRPQIWIGKRRPRLLSAPTMCPRATVSSLLRVLASTSQFGCTEDVGRCVLSSRLSHDQACIITPSMPMRGTVACKVRSPHAHGKRWCLGQVHFHQHPSAARLSIWMRNVCLSSYGCHTVVSF